MNIPRYRTRTEAGKKIPDIVARNARKWGGASAIGIADRDALVQAAQWLAASGTGDNPSKLK